MLGSVRAFERRLSAKGGRSRPVLVLRLPEFERVAWRRGLRAARALERASTAAFSSAVARVLRVDDLAAHDGGSDVFIAALLDARVDAGSETGIDPRAALARIAASVEATTRLPIDTGWTMYSPDTDRGNMPAVMARALLRGEQERQRYGFFSALGHELRTPLASIQGYLETLLDGELGSTTRERFVRIAYQESLRMHRLVEGMFEISLLDLRETSVPFMCGSLHRALEAARTACAATATARGAKLTVSEAPSLWTALDVERLTLVLINLIDNAVKHGRPGGQVCVRAACDERDVRIVVDDDGPGVPAADRERVFAFGARAATEAAGTGIGLALVRLLVERTGGRIELTDSPLGGTRCSLSLPRRPDPAT